jgi:hypothetical protein
MKSSFCSLIPFLSLILQLPTQLKPSAPKLISRQADIFSSSEKMAALQEEKI